MRYARTIIGYHGCARTIARRVLSGEPMRHSENSYDWLGRGIYFWEYGPDRAMRFIEAKLARKKSRAKPAVLGAVIQLGGCFDLLDTRFTRELSDAYDSFVVANEAGGVELPKNAGDTPDQLLRRLDCTVLNWYLESLESQRGVRYQTVRGCFFEGGPAYPGAGVQRESHIQIAVSDAACILGVFLAR